MGCLVSSGDFGYILTAVFFSPILNGVHYFLYTWNTDKIIEFLKVVEFKTPETSNIIQFLEHSPNKRVNSPFDRSLYVPPPSNVVK